MTIATIPVPEWLKLRDGSMRPGVRAETLFVMIGNQPLYKLEVRPAAGTFACAVSNTVNGKRLDDAKKTYASTEAAFTGGLEQLQNALGW